MKQISSAVADNEPQQNIWLIKHQEKYNVQYITIPEYFKMKGFYSSGFHKEKKAMDGSLCKTLKMKGSDLQNIRTDNTVLNLFNQCWLLHFLV